MKLKMIMNINFKDRIEFVCDYSKSVTKVTNKCIKQLPTDIINNKELLYACVFWFISKFIEDERISMDDYLTIINIKKDEFTKNESKIFNYYLTNSTFQKALNALMFDGEEDEE